MTQSNIKQILDMLDTLQEQLLSLPDDMLLTIDPRDNDSIDRGTAFIKAYNHNLKQFSESSRRIAMQVKEHFSINPEEEELVQETGNRLQRDRIIKELDKSAPHSLHENFTYKRPYGFILGNSAFKGLKTWKSMYMHVLSILEKMDNKKFGKLTTEEKFISRRGNPLFSTNTDVLRVSEKFTDTFYVEVNLSANNIRNNIIELLTYFGLNPDEVKVYLREDRDA